jgi:uncharacterized integral membrane protein
MRTVLVLLVIAVVAGFAAQNWPEVTRSSELLFGPIVMTAPLGLILLGLAALALIMFVFSAYAGRSRLHREERQHHETVESQRRALDEQRDLADRAEASRFTELRQHIDRSMHELRMEVAQMGRNMQGRIGELESRVDGRLRGGGNNWPSTSTPAVRHDEPRGEHALAEAPLDRARAEQIREDQLRESREREERERQERLRNESERRPGLFRNWR